MPSNPTPSNQWTKPLLAAITAGIVLALAIILTLAPKAQAADLGGTCCADLDERIAELEATVAKKGNRKVQLFVYGQISKAMVHFDIDDYNNLAVSENSNAESFIGFRGEANLQQGWKAGFTLELGVGGYDDSLKSYSGYGPLTNSDTDGIYARQSNVWVDGPFGRGTIGLASQATDGIAEISVANTLVASRPLSLRPLTGPQILEVLELFDGQRANLVRYDSPVFAGFKFSASYAPGVDDGPHGQGDVWDAALRWSGEYGGFALAAGAGYREGIVIQTIGKAEDTDTLSGSGSAKHIASGLFLNGTYGDLDLSDLTTKSANVKGWQATGGWEQRFFSIGHTTIFAEYGEIDLGDVLTDQTITLAGVGLVQSIDAAAMDVYVTGRKYDFDDLTGGNDLTVLMAGGKIRF